MQVVRLEQQVLLELQGQQLELQRLLRMRCKQLERHNRKLVLEHKLVHIQELGCHSKKLERRSNGVDGRGSDRDHSNVLDDRSNVVDDRSSDRDRGNVHDHSSVHDGDRSNVQREHRSS